MASEVSRTKAYAIVVGSDDAICVLARKYCAMQGLPVVRAVPPDALQRIRHNAPVGIFVASRIELSTLRELRAAAPESVLCVMLAPSQGSLAPDARLIADHVLSEPASTESVLAVLRAFVQRARSETPDQAPRVLMLERDRFLAQSLASGLSPMFRVTRVETIAQALAHAGEHEPDVVLSELPLDVSPATFHLALEDLQPGLSSRVVYMTGGMVDEGLHAFLSTIPGRWIYKPFPLATLSSLLAGVLARRPRLN